MLLATGCNFDSPAKKHVYSFKPLEWDEREPDTKRMQRLAEGNSQFAFDLYRQISAEQAGGFAVSPYSISSSLAMVYGGVKGESKEQIAQVLKFSMDEAELHDAFADQEYRYEYWIGLCGECSLANSLWPQQGYPLPEGFTELAEEYYNTEIHEVDFNDSAETAGMINAWTAAQTNNFLPKAVDPGMFDSLSRLVLVNAIVFTKGWEANKYFREVNTKDAPFFIKPDEDVQVRMMFQNGYFRVALGESFTALELPLEDETSLLIVLPNEIDGLAAVEDELTTGLLTELRENLSRAEVEVYLPRLVAKSEVDLAATLHDMGLRSIFDWSDDLDEMVGDSGMPLKVSDLLHDAYIKVNERGVEAAATTTGHCSVLSRYSAPPDKVVFRADHPFFFLIQDDKTGAVFFMCRIVNPAQYGNQDELDALPTS